MSGLKSRVESFTLPPLLKEEVSVISKTGFYSSNSEFIRDAIRTLLASRKDLRTAIAVELYKTGKISLGRASEIVRVDYEEMKKILVDRGIELKRGSKSVKELKNGSKKLSKLVE